MKRALLLPYLLLALASSHGQYGYLGAKHVVSIGVNDRIWSDAWSLSVFRAIGRNGGLRLDARYLTVDSEARTVRYGWLGSYASKKFGVVQGSGFGVGLHWSASAKGGLSQPLGYYMSIGLEFCSATTTDRFDPSFFPSDWNPRGKGPEYTFEFTHKGFRLVYDWGIRKVLAERISLDLGMQLGYLLYHSIQSDQDAIGPSYAIGYERNMIFRFNSPLAEGSYGVNNDQGLDVRGISLTPMMRLGFVF